MKDGKTPNPNVIHPIKGYDNEIYINVDKLGSGTYVVKINSETINTAKLFIIKK